MPVLRSILRSGALALAYGGGIAALTAIAIRQSPPVKPAKPPTTLLEGMITIKDDGLTEGEKHALRMRILAMACDED